MILSYCRNFLIAADLSTSLNKLKKNPNPKHKKTKPTTKAKHESSLVLSAGILALEVIKNVTVLLNGISTQLYFYQACLGAAGGTET